MNGKEWVNSSETAKQFVKGKGSEVYSSAKRLERVCLESGDINSWDFSLITRVLQTVELFTSGEQNRQNSSQVKEENEKIESLSSILDKWAHNSNLYLTDEKLNQLWNVVIVILTSFGESEKELKLLKNKQTISETVSNEDNQENGVKAKQLKERGNECFRKQEFTQSIDNYSEALALKGLKHQEIAVLYSNRSIVYLKLTETSNGVKSGSMSGPIDHNDLRYKALLDAKKSLELSPFWPKAYHRIGCAYHSLNKFSKAIYNFDRALALEPTNEEMISARDLSQHKLAEENRFEHLDDKRMSRTLNEGHKESSHESMKLPTLPKGIDVNFKYDLPTIHRYAENGSLFAQRMRTAMFYLFQSFNALEEFKVSQIELNAKNVSIIKFVQNYANSIREEQLVTTLPLNMYSIADKLIDKVLKSEANSKSQLDIDARVCYSHLHSNSLDKTILFLKECTKKYPNESYFYQVCGCLYTFKKEYNKGLNELNVAFKLTPNDYEVLYYRAGSLRLEGSCDPKDTIRAYMNFLEIAPKDHRKVPESYYAIATLQYDLHSNMNGNQKKRKFFNHMVSQVKSYYEKGLNAEKNQLPFFMPYESNIKKYVEILLKMFEKNAGPTKTVIPDKIPIKKNNINDKLTDPYRIELIRQFREYTAQNRKIRENSFSAAIHLTTTAPKQQKALKSIVGFKPINLKDMNPTRDHIYKGFVMKVTFIEDAFNNVSSIINLIRDENNDIQRFCLYNYEHINNDSIVQQNYGIGCKISLMNPYMRMAHDGKPAIRIDDPKSLLKIGDELVSKNMCRYCGSENATKKCGRCKTALYCDRNCQEKDWNHYKHKFICYK